MLSFYYNFIKKNFLIMVPLILVLTRFPFLDFVDLRFTKLISFQFYDVLLIFSASIIFIKNPSKFYDFNLILLLIFSFLYPVFSVLNYKGKFGISETFVSTFLASSFYIIGKYVYSLSNDETKLIKIIFLFIIIFSIVPLISNITAIIQNGFMVGREVHLIWSELDFYSATVFAIFFALNVSLFPLLLISVKKKEEKTIKKVAAFIFIAGLLCVANLLTRTSFILIGISALTVIGILDRDNIRSYIFKLIILGFVVIILMASFLSLLKISPLYIRFFVQSGDTGFLYTRSHIWDEALDLLIKYPMGGTQRLSTALYAHNLWLDVGYKTGIIVLTVLLIFTIRYLAIVRILIFKRKLSMILRTIILCLSVGFLGTFMVEPIMEGAFLFFCFFCFFFGMFYSLNKQISFRHF